MWQLNKMEIIHLTSLSTVTCSVWRSFSCFQFTVKTFRLLQPYFGHPKLLVCVTCKVQRVLTIWKSEVEKLPYFVELVSPFR